MAKTETINAGENLELNVQDLPENLQRLVSIYDETNEKLSKAKSDALIYGAAAQYFLSNITAGIDAYLKSKNAETVEESSEPSGESIED